MNGRGSAADQGPRSGFSVLELAALLLLITVLMPPLARSAGELRATAHLLQAVEDAARLFTEARWTAVSTGGATVELFDDPPHGRVIDAAGDTIIVSSLGPGGVRLRLSRGRPGTRLRYGPLGLGLVSSQTLRFTSGGQERVLVVSALGRLSRR